MNAFESSHNRTSVRRSLNKFANAFRKVPFNSINGITERGAVSEFYRLNSVFSYLFLLKIFHNTCQTFKNAAKTDTCFD